MPRTDWLAIGAVVAALSLGLHGDRIPIAAAASAVVASALAVAFARSIRGPVLALTVGAVAIVLRATLIPSTPAPSGALGWIARPLTWHQNSSPLARRMMRSSE